MTADKHWMDVRLLQEEDEVPPPVPPNDSEVLINTLTLYGTLFAILWLLFCWLRLLYPRTYNIRSWVEDIRCKLAGNQFGFFSWFMELHTVSDKQFMDQCGFDSLCLVRILRWATRVSCAGTFCALWLIPVYGSAEASPETDYITDYIASITTAHLPPGSPRLLATTIAAYIVFGCSLYFLYEEFEWFRYFRYRFLHQPRSRNYTVYVHGIPEEYKADYDLANFFQVCFGLGRVQEAHVRLDTPELDKLTPKRDVVVQKLEHAINILNVKGVRPTHKVAKREVDSITQYAYELRDFNLQITRRIEILEDGGAYDAIIVKSQEIPMHIKIQGEGMPLDGAFVSFYNLSSKQAAIQMNHARQPFSMQVTEAPDPDDILWENVGKDHVQIQVGSLTSVTLTVAICLLWTIPISFFSGMSNIEGLEAQFDFIREANEANPWLRAVLAQVAPFLVVIVNALLPVILKFLSTMECHISNAMVQASLFTKLAAFMIIQTFFISAIAGSAVSQLSAVINDPTLIIELLANELPGQSTFFIQLVFISTVLGIGIEQLRIVPVVLASLRSCIGPNLTEEERNSPYLFLNPLAIPPIFNHASALSNVVFFCMILFVYAVIAPLTSIVMLVAFPIISAGYRHQFIYIYPPTQESGGRMWMSFVGITINCMIVAQFTIFGLLGLKQGAVAAPLMLPLIIVTFLFKAYLGQRHFEAMECLPSHECHKKDAASDFYITESFEDLFVRPELMIKEAFPGNIDSKLLNEISIIPRKNPLKKKKRKHKGQSVAKTEEANTEEANTEQATKKGKSGQPTAKGETEKAGVEAEAVTVEDEHNENNQAITDAANVENRTWQHSRDQQMQDQNEQALMEVANAESLGDLEAQREASGTPPASI